MINISPNEMEKNKVIKILTVDDEERMLHLLSVILEKEGYHVLKAFTGLEAIALVKEVAPDLIILDLMMPVMGGLETCTRIREISNIPIIMLTAKASEKDKIIGLKGGADDYMIKPFSKDELLARIEAVLRRADKTEKVPVLTFQEITIQTLAKRVNVNGKDIQLTRKEFEILELMMNFPDQVFSREMLLQRIWGQDYTNATSRTVDTHIKTLRIKLGDCGKYITTIWGMGYKIEVIK